MKNLIAGFISMMLTVSVANAEPYKRPLDLHNPYNPPTAFFQEGYDHNPEYLKGRRQVAEACQDLRMHFRKKNRLDFQLLVDECDPDAMEWKSLEICQRNGVALTECPVAGMMQIQAEVLRDFLRDH